ncbi:MAG: molybdopterin dinucleotide binding domain-containing protein, partial [Streptosporangiaceae bacterium]
RTGSSPRLSAHEPEPFLAIHPRDAELAGAGDRGLCRLISAYGSAVLRVRHEPEQPAGTVFAPMHWTSRFASHARVDSIVNAAADPLSGQPELKHTPVRIEALTPRWQAFLISRRAVEIDDASCSYWAVAVGRSCWRYELAGEAPPKDWHHWAEALLPPDPAGSDRLDYLDLAAAVYRQVRLVEGRLEVALYVAGDRPEIARGWLAALFDEADVRRERLALLGGRPSGNARMAGQLICACLNVGRDVVERSIREGGVTSIAAIGDATGAGTGCGSCRPELSTMLRRHTSNPRVDRRAGPGAAAS